MDVDGSLIDDDVFSPDGIKQILSAEHLPWFEGERHEEPILFGSQ